MRLAVAFSTLRIEPLVYNYLSAEWSCDVKNSIGNLVMGGARHGHRSRGLEFQYSFG